MVYNRTITRFIADDNVVISEWDGRYDWLLWVELSWVTLSTFKTDEQTQWRLLSHNYNTSVRNSATKQNNYSQKKSNFLPLDKCTGLGFIGQKTCFCQLWSLNRLQWKKSKYRYHGMVQRMLIHCSSRLLYKTCKYASCYVSGIK